MGALWLDSEVQGKCNLQEQAAMLEDDDSLPVPDAEFYRRYLEACRRLGIKPVSFERVGPLVGEWNRLILAGKSTATTMQ